MLEVSEVILVIPLSGSHTLPPNIVQRVVETGGVTQRLSVHGLLVSCLMCMNVARKLMAYRGISLS